MKRAILIMMMLAGVASGQTNEVLLNTNLISIDVIERDWNKRDYDTLHMTAEWAEGLVIEVEGKSAIRSFVVTNGIITEIKESK